VRVLVALCAQWGHLYPTLPTALALRARGHDVTYATVDVPALRAIVEGVGLRFVGLSLTRDEELAIMNAGTARVAAMPSSEREEQALPAWFLPLADRMIDDLTRLARRADLLVHELTTFAGPLAAAIAGVPSVLHGTGASSPAAVRYAAAAMTPRWNQRGLEPAPMAGLFGALYLDLFPPSIPEPAAAVAPSVQPLRPGLPVDPAPAPLWVRELGDRPVVLVTLGTNFNRDHQLWSEILGAVGDRHVDVIAAMGPGNDPAVLGPLPPNVRAEMFIPLGSVIPKCSVVVCHAGAGTTLQTLSLGIPLVLVPQGADQFYIADRVEAARAGVRLRAGDDPGEAVRRALVDPELRRGSGRIRREIEAMPDADAAACALERVVEQA